MWIYEIIWKCPIYFDSKFHDFYISFNFKALRLQIWLDADFCRWPLIVFVYGRILKNATTIDFIIWLKAPSCLFCCTLLIISYQKFFFNSKREIVCLLPANRCLFVIAVLPNESFPICFSSNVTTYIL